MNAYRVEILPDAEEKLDSLDKPLAERILGKLEWLAANIEALRLKPLHGTLDGFFKLRIGDYRVVYSLDWEARLITVHLTGSREDIYKRRL